MIEEELKNGSKTSIHRDAISDDEETFHQKETVVRKAELLDVDNSDDEFQLKTNCNRRKSLDFNRERLVTLSKSSNNNYDLVRNDEQVLN